MVFVTYGYITSTQGLKFSSDLKLGHYMKIPPRLLFSIQQLSPPSCRLAFLTGCLQTSGEFVL
ncbi:hypothetical protein L211DRAFT_841963 [Terfezia boudieri ATCC MYA-4762]|uniref:Uncharacterized protein n=1 Tax=Terfezia boudieri ATCC MYA-4762 TaxID=1051890 RepID=A0A3N4LF06_9PEZI|nr:hypothetical protein L211DRAFT_841963 [Terfezia boudieri ATCC MYA-4762]